MRKVSITNTTFNKYTYHWRSNMTQLKATIIIYPLHTLAVGWGTTERKWDKEGLVVYTPFPRLALGERCKHEGASFAHYTPTAPRPS